MATASNNYVQRGYKTWLYWDTLDAHTSTLGSASWVVRTEYRVPWPPWTGHLGHFGPPCVFVHVCVCVCVCVYVCVCVCVERKVLMDYLGVDYIPTTRSVYSSDLLRGCPKEQHWVYCGHARPCCLTLRWSSSQGLHRGFPHRRVPWWPSSCPSWHKTPPRTPAQPHGSHSPPSLWEGGKVMWLTGD